MRLVFIHQYFSPEVAGSAIRLTELAFGLAELGIAIDVYTGFPSYEGKQAAPQKETHGTLTIHRLGKTRFDRKSAFGRILNGLTFFFSAFWKLNQTPKDALLFIGSDPPFLILLGWLMKRWRGQHYVLHIADLYPDIAVALGFLKRDGFLDRLLKGVNRLSFRRAERIVTLGRTMREKIISYLTDETASKAAVIENWENGDWIRPRAKRDNWFAKEHGLLEKTTVLYSGNFGLAHDLESVMEAARLLKSEPEILFLFIGGGGKKEFLINYSQKNGLANVLFLPYQPVENLPYSLTAGDIALVSMQKGTEGFFVPGKLYTALASGLALLGISPPNTETAELIEHEDCGLTVPPEAPKEIAAAILKLHRNSTLLSRYQHNARKTFEQHFTKERAIHQYEELFCSVTGQARKPTLSLTGAEAS